MRENKAERRCCSNERSNVLYTADVCSITRDVLLAVAGVALIVGVPFLMALMKQMGVW